MPVAASIGAVADVALWHPLAQDGRQFHLDSDSSLGAFYEITDAAALQPVFEDSPLMQSIFNRALEELIVPLEVDGRTLAAAFLCGKDLHPAWAGYDANGVGVAGGPGQRRQHLVRPRPVPSALIAGAKLRPFPCPP